MNGEASFRCIISGRVQGVGFRFFVREVAVSLGVSGYVRNLPDGSVEVAAQGPRDCLERLVEAIRQGPPAARVSDVDITWQQPDGDGPAGFELRY